IFFNNKIFLENSPKTIAVKARFLGVFYIKNTIKRTQTEHKTKNTATFLPQNKTISNFQRINFPSLSATYFKKSLL
ncbi:MAG: hypothetical protein MSA79_01705, partial [Campylobacter sp.]|nr:hypothetical protein [Campylobacter sp.]